MKAEAVLSVKPEGDNTTEGALVPKALVTQTLSAINLALQKIDPLCLPKDVPLNDPNVAVTYVTTDDDDLHDLQRAEAFPDTYVEPERKDQEAQHFEPEESSQKQHPEAMIVDDEPKEPPCGNERSGDGKALPEPAEEAEPIQRVPKSRKERAKTQAKQAKPKSVPKKKPAPVKNTKTKRGNAQKKEDKEIPKKKGKKAAVGGGGPPDEPPHDDGQQDEEMNEKELKKQLHSVTQLHIHAKWSKQTFFQLSQLLSLRCIPLDGKLRRRNTQQIRSCGESWHPSRERSRLTSKYMVLITCFISLFNDSSQPRWIIANGYQDSELAQKYLD